MKVLMVCLGNICRSPLAEGILKHKAKEKGLDWVVESAGTGAWHIDEKPDRRSMKEAKKNGIDISDQRAKQFSTYDFEVYDTIYVMDSSNYRDVIKQATSAEEEAKVKLIMNELYPDENRAVPDPYWDTDGFSKVYQMLDEACDRIISKYDSSKF